MKLYMIDLYKINTILHILFVNKDFFGYYIEKNN